ncbi:MAG: hypothetical protein IPL79_03965 [Myxococcales bacterium]|nr:hypothetical protein [Myxococcales bacterium]
MRRPFLPLRALFGLLLLGLLTTAACMEQGTLVDGPDPSGSWVNWLERFESAVNGSTQSDRDRRKLSLDFWSVQSSLAPPLAQQGATCLQALLQSSPGVRDCYRALSFAAIERERAELGAPNVSQSWRLKAQHEALASTDRLDVTVFWRMYSAAKRGAWVDMLLHRHGRELVIGLVGTAIAGLLWLVGGRRKRPWYGWAVLVATAPFVLALALSSLWVGMTAGFGVALLSGRTRGAGGLGLLALLLAYCVLWYLADSFPPRCDACTAETTAGAQVVCIGRDHVDHGCFTQLEYQFLQGLVVAQRTVDRTLRAQSNVRVRYNPANPFEHRLVDDRRDPEALWVSGSVVALILAAYAAYFSLVNSKRTRLRRFLNTSAVVCGTASAVGYAVVLVEFRLYGIYPLIMGTLLALGALVVWNFWAEKKEDARRGDRTPMM